MSTPTPDDCELERFERNHYFDGKLLTARDMADEQAYHVDRLATLARYVLGDGVVCGLAVEVRHTSGEEDVTVELSEGLAVDCCGNLVVVEGGFTEEFTPQSTADELYLSLRYRECFRETVPIPNSGDACEEDCAYNRILEVFELVAEPTPPGDTEPSMGSVSFPREDELAARASATDLDATDPELLRIARTYHERERATCPECEDPHVYLCQLELDNGVWQIVGGSERSDLVYPNEMLYSAIARHTADFRNPHATSLTVLAGESVPNETSARVRVEDEATDDEAVTISTPSAFVDISATPGTKTIELTTPGIEALADRLSDLETTVTGLETTVTDLEETVSDLEEDVDENEADIDRLERYVMDKTLKYKLASFGRLAETFAGTVGGDVAAAVVERTWSGIDEQVYTDPAAFRAFLGETEQSHQFEREGIEIDDVGSELVVTLGAHRFVVDRDEYDGDVAETDTGFAVELTLVELEQLVGDALVGLAESTHEPTYEDAVSALEEALTGDGTPLDLALAQDLVCETAEWLEPTTEEGDLTVDLTSSEVAVRVSDSVTVFGTARGQGDDVRVYLVSPDGQFRTADGEAGAESVDVAADAYEREYTAFDEPGEYVYIVAGRGPDGEYASSLGFSRTEPLPSGQSHEEAIDTVLRAYAEGDDLLVDRVLAGEPPSLTVDDFTADGSVRQGPVIVTGTSNREDGTTISVEIRARDGSLVASAESAVRGASNDWVANFNLSRVPTGQYLLRASDGQQSASRAFRLITRVIGPIIPTPDFDVVRDAEIEVVDGIGPTRSERLREAEIARLSDLVVSDPDRVADVAGVSPETAKKWRVMALERLRE